MTDMSLSTVTTGRVQRPLRISLYGVDGVGKTQFGAGSPKPIFLATEDGTHHVDVARFPIPQAWADIVGPAGAIKHLATEPHDFQTLVIDSMDWAETLCDRHVVDQYNIEMPAKQISSITEIPYGGWKGRKLVAFSYLLDLLDYLVRARNMHIICISHANIVRFEDPERDAYERYAIKLFPALAARVREWSDYNLFANYDTTLSQVGQGFGARTVGISHGKRLLFSQRKAAYDAKARFPIPDRLDLSWDAFWQAHWQAAGFSK